jgi:uncharacterized protein YxeA
MKKIILLCSILTFISISFAEDPIAEQPVYKEGDTYVYFQKNEKKNKETKIKLEFLRMDGDNYVFLKNGKKERVWDANLTSLKRKEHGRYPGSVIKFPLKQGKKWEYTHLSGMHGGPDFSKRSTERTTTFEVVAYEEVTVPAGTFWAYKITATVEGGAGTPVERGTHTYWYAPDVKQVIKSSEFRIGTMELIKYKLK